MDALGIDIGGAFIKWAAVDKGELTTGIIPLELYRHPERLVQTLCAIKTTAPTVITMTGELCDCFENRAQGVKTIVEAAANVFADCRFFTVDGDLVTAPQAVTAWRQVASANWAAPARYLADKVDDLLLVDIGSTTADLTPIRDGCIANKGWDDHGRLKHGELLYTGCLRTPLYAVLPRAEVRGVSVPLAPEYFAVMGDVYLALGMIGADEYLTDTPDGKGKGSTDALRRIARCLMADFEDVGEEATLAVAQQAAAAQQRLVVEAVQRFDLPVAVTGTGAFILNNAQGLEQATLPEGVTVPDPAAALAASSGGSAREPKKAIL